jgi:hypothetical protein
MSIPDKVAEGGSGSRLFYYGTQIEVHVGDRIRIRRWFRQDLEGVVCYIPGVSPRHTELEYEDVKKWAFKTTDGTTWATVYSPEQAQPKKKMKFVARSDDLGISPETTLL